MVRVFRQGDFECPLQSKRCVARTKHRDRRQCSRVSFRIPFCLQHVRRHIGVQVRMSTIPGVGCGLFAERHLQKGDVLGPYTGEQFRSVAEMQAARNGEVSVYSYEGPRGIVVDASCERGIMAYINDPRGSGQRSNVRGVHFTIRFTAPTNHQNLFGAPDEDTGLCPVLSARECGRRNPFHDKGWRRVPFAFLQAPFLGASFLWLFASENVPAGSELFWRYRSGGDHLRVVHSTTPRPCPR